MPTEKTQPSCPGSRDLNWTGKELKNYMEETCGQVEDRELNI
jgi:hypothetical protein